MLPVAFSGPSRTVAPVPWRMLVPNAILAPCLQGATKEWSNILDDPNLGAEALEDKMAKAKLLDKFLPGIVVREPKPETPAPDSENATPPPDSEARFAGGTTGLDPPSLDHAFDKW